jgi:hypothetical protein
MFMNYVKWYLTSRNIYQSFVQLVSEQCREHVTMLSALYRANTLSLIFVNSPQEDMSFYSDTSFWFRTNQSLYFFLNAVSNANFIVTGVPEPGIEPTFSHIQRQAR